MKSNISRCLLCSIILVIFGLVTSRSLEAGTRYTVTDLGIPEGDYTGTSATGINEWGQVVGTVESFDHPQPDDDYSIGFVWDSTNGFRLLETLGGRWNSPRDINESGEIVGRSYFSSGDWHALLWKNGAATDLGPGWARSINNSGQVVGEYGRVPNFRGFIWDSTSGMQFPFGTGEIQPHAINDFVQVVGRARNAESQFQAFTWNSTDGLEFLDLPLGFISSSAWDINGSGQIVGTAASTQDFACIWETIDSLETYVGEYRWGEAAAINDLGQVVGQAIRPGEAYNRGVIWDRDSGMQLLDDFIYPYDGLEYINWTGDINNSGQIVATARINGKSHAVLLTPVSEPLPEISVAPTSHDFGSVVVYYSASMDITINNLGDADLTISNIVLSDDTNFSLIGDTMAVVGPGGSHVVTVDFNPQSTGQFSATVTINSDDLDEPQVKVDLIGASESVVWGCIDFQGSPLVGVEVRLKQEGGKNQATTTDSAGCYYFDVLNADNGCKIEINFPPLSQ